MDHLPLVCTLLGAAAITPGPNNLVVLRAAAHGGLRGAIPAIAGIVTGGLLLFTVSALGVDAVYASHPVWRGWIGTAGALYLGWLGLALLIGALARPHREAAPMKQPMPTSTLTLLGFQFLNPKSWVMVLTVLATWSSAEWRGYLPLAALFVLIPLACLLLWAGLGAWLARWLARSAIRRGVDTVMGVLLFACALLLPTLP